MENRPTARPRAPNATGSPAGRHPASAVEKSANLVTAILRGCAPKGGVCPGHVGVWEPNVSQDDVCVLGELFDAMGVDLTSPPPDQRVTLGPPPSAPSDLRPASVILDRIRWSDLALTRLTDELRRDGRGDDVPARLGDALKQALVVVEDIQIQRGDLALADLTIAARDLHRDGWMEGSFLAGLVDTMEHNSTLKGLVIDASGEIPAADYGPLFKALGHGASIRELTLRNCNLAGEFAREVMNGFVANNASLDTISLSGCRLDGGGVGVVAAALPGCARLRCVDIQSCDIHEDILVDFIRCHWLIAAQEVTKEAGRLRTELRATVGRGGIGGATLLFRAAYCGHAEVVQLLFDYGADINTAQNSGVTPMFAAAHNGHADVVRLLFELGADANRLTNSGVMPVHVAAKNGHTEVVRLLVGFGADVSTASNDGATPMFFAAAYGHASVVRLLAELGADVSTPLPSLDLTPVIAAAQEGHVEVVRLLIEEFMVDINTPMNGGFTLVYVAIESGRVPVVRLLAELGADISTPMNCGVMPVHAAAIDGHAEIVRLLIEDFMADANKACDDGTTSVFIAAQNGHTDAVRVLAELGANINTPRNDGTTPLRMGITQGKLEVVKSLLLLGARFNAHDLRSEPPAPSTVNIRQVRADLLSWADDALAQHSTFHSTFLCGCMRENTVLAPLGGLEQLRAEVAQFVGIKTGVELQHLRAVRAVIAATDQE